MSKLVFVTIGFVEFHKGQDLLIEAIESIDSDLLEQCEFIIVGNSSSLFAKELKERIKKISCIKMLGIINRKEIHRLLTCSNVLICPSREDSMPTVCAEAMMHKIPCIVSSAVGTSIYINHKHNGLVFSNGNVDDLMNNIIWCINNKYKLIDMGEKAYDVYKKYFSVEAFEEKLMKYVREMIIESDDIDECN